MEYFAHTDEKNPGRKQYLHEHLRETAARAEGFAPPALKPLARLSGLMHDAGKYQRSFQEKLNGKNIRIEHSQCGAIWCIDEAKANVLQPLSAYAMAYCIAGHHAGLPDGGCSSDEEYAATLKARLKRTPEDFRAFCDEIEQELHPEDCNAWVQGLKDFLQNESGAPTDTKVQQELYAFEVRLLYSCLVDADFLNTEEFCSENSVLRGMSTAFAACLQRLEAKLNAFPLETTVQKSRKLLQQQAIQTAQTDAEIYLMNMPTGSGKTLCSLYVALQRAQKTNKKRIIYVIPYTSIIEQTAKIFEELFGKGVVLQHHSNYDYDKKDEEDCDLGKLARRSAENWEASVIITTNVQFFESIYSNRSSKLRRLHNLQDSIIVFDEVHMMPTDYLAPCLRAVGYLAKRFHCEALFLTATMPDFRAVFERYTDVKLKIQDLITDTSSFPAFRNCRYQFLGKTENERLSELAAEQDNALIVVNSRRKARELYALLPEPKYHLSTYLTAYDRSRIIKEIRGDLKNNRKITVVATSLIEAGVDLDFACVFRELSGLDSILQAGGRCNREGRRPTDCPVFIFEGEASKCGDLSVRQNIAKAILQTYGEQINTPEAISAYYAELYAYRARDIVSHDMKDYIKFLKSEWFFSIDFKRYADEFHLIDSAAISVVVPYDQESKNLVNALKYSGNLGAKRKLQRYAASIFENELRDLCAQGAVDDFGTGLYVLLNLDYYDPNLGLKTTNENTYIYGR